MGQIHSFADVTVDTRERMLVVRGKNCSLTGRAFDLLVVLCERAGQLISKDELLDAVWGATIVEEANLHVHVSALRKLLGSEAIETVPGRGYRFTLAGKGVVVTPGTYEPVTLANAAAHGGNVSPLPLIGREHDVAALEELLVRHRLLTVIGSGGVGKTRLAAAVLWSAQSRFADGVATVELASITEPHLVAGAVATALKLSVGREGTGWDALLAAARPVEALLLLDNAEHLVEELAKLVQALLQAAPSLRVLVTSQMPLRIEQEQVFRLGGLDVPAGNAQTTASEGLLFGAVALFHDRLRAADRRLQVDESNIAAVLDICRCLDGIPLALELAAARCAVLGVSGVAARLDERFRLLRFDSRSAPSRQQTLGAAMTWSHGLLAPEHQAAYRQLGVFLGTFTLDMAVRVIRVGRRDDMDCIDLIAELVDRSLISVDTGDPPRYRLLETGRLFAMARLVESGEEAEFRLRHARVLRDRFDHAWDESWVIGEDSFVERYEPDLDNLRAALDEAMLHDRVAAIAMAGAATRLWRLLSLHPEATSRCLAAVALIDESTPLSLEARLWEGIAQVCGELSHAEGRPAAERAAEIYERIGDARGRYLALAHLIFSYSGSQSAEAAHAFAEMQRLEDPLWPAAVRLFGRKVEANFALSAGQFEIARTATRARLELASACASQRDVNAALGNLADLALITGIPAEAVRLGRALLIRLRRRDVATRAVIMGNLLHALLAQGVDGEARTLATELVDVLRQLGFMFLMYVADAMALLAARERRWRAAALLLGYADSAYAAQHQERELNEARAYGEARQGLAAHCQGSE
ncbi:MAG: helix-turn-helix transcriptional regulator, partial [Pseudomonadota bacterium]|nr:helix-turn-helix transcriptional regulator [Pseudomonadota bacterium]